MPEPSVLDLGPANLVEFTADRVQPPTTLYVGLNDAIRVRTINDQSISYVLTVRLLLPDGKISVQEENFVNANVKVGQNNDFRVAEGFILSIALNTPGAIARGVAYGSISIMRTFGAATVQQYMIASGYVTLLHTVVWPTVLSDFPQNKPGRINFAQPSVPAAGADWLFTVNASSRMRLMSINCTLTTSAAVANRTVQLVIKSAGATLWQIACGATQAASLGAQYSFGPGAPTQAAFLVGSLSTGTPVDFVLSPGSTVRTVTNLIDAADQWSGIQIATEDNFDL